MGIESITSGEAAFDFHIHTVKLPRAYIVSHRKPRGCQCVKSKLICNPNHNIVGLRTLFEAAGSVVTVKRSPVSKRVKAREIAKGADILSSGQSKPLLERDSV